MLPVNASKADDTFSARKRDVSTWGQLANPGRVQKSFLMGNGGTYLPKPSPEQKHLYSAPEYGVC